MDEEINLEDAITILKLMEHRSKDNELIYPSPLLESSIRRVIKEIKGNEDIIHE